MDDGMTGLRRSAGAVIDALANQWADRLPMHLWYRIAMLVGDEDVVYATTDVEGVEPGVYSGRVLVLTPTRVILATAARATDGDAEGHEASVRVESWRRSDIQSLSIGDGEAAGADVDWNDAFNRWPRSGRLTVTYEGRDTICLPLEQRPSSESRNALRTAVDGLVRDLSRQSG
jgi:hypothetical protein